MIVTTTLVAGTQQFGRYTANSNLRWEELGDSLYGTWADWTTYNPDPGSLQIKIYIDALVVDRRVPTLDFEALGTVTVSLVYGDTEDSNGIVGGTTVNFVEGVNEEIDQARYYEWTITVDTDSNFTVPQITPPAPGFDVEEITEVFRGVDTSTLSGTIDARELDTTVGSATTIIATARQEGVTNSTGLLNDRHLAVPDDYVFQENAIIVNTVSLSPPTIRCFDLNGESIDAVVDVMVTGVGSAVLTPNGVTLT